MTTPRAETLVLTLANGMVLFSRVALEAGGYSWQIDCDAPGGGIISGYRYPTPDRAISALFCAAAEQGAARVISAMPREQWEASIGIAGPKDRVDEIATLKTENASFRESLRAIVETEPIGREGDCLYCREYVGPVVDDYFVEVEDWPRERLGKRQYDHKLDCVWLRARKALGMGMP